MDKQRLLIEIIANEESNNYKIHMDCHMSPFHIAKSMIRVLNECFETPEEKFLFLVELAENSLK